MMVSCRDCQDTTSEPVNINRHTTILSCTIAKFTPNYYVTNSLSIIFHLDRVSDPAVWQNLLILAAISLVVLVGGIQLFQRTGYR